MNANEIVWRVCTGCVWFRIWNYSKLLWTQQWTLSFHNRREKFNDWLIYRQPSKENSYVNQFNGFKRIKENLHRIRYGEIFMWSCDRTFISHLAISHSTHRIMFLLLCHITRDFSITRYVSVFTFFLAVATVFNVKCEWSVNSQFIVEIFCNRRRHLTSHDVMDIGYSNDKHMPQTSVYCGLSKWP